MRSQLVFSAGFQVANRFLLATIAMRVTRRLHIVSTRTEQTVNGVLIAIGNGQYTDAQFPKLEPLPAIDSLLAIPA